MVKRKLLIDFLTHISELYMARYQLPLWKKYPNHLHDFIDGMCIFLEGYAFERQGRNPSFSHAAVDVIKDAKATNRKFAEVVWNLFSHQFGGDGLNRKVNPIYHIGVKTGGVPNSDRLARRLRRSSQIFLFFSSEIIQYSHSTNP